MTQEVDGHLHEEPSLEMKKCDLTWSILSTEIDYTINKHGSPYTEMNSSNLYNKLSEDEQLITSTTVYKSNVNLAESVGGLDLDLFQGFSIQDTDPHLPHHINDD